MSDYLRRVDEILDNLKYLSADANESMAITKIMSSLPGQHQHFISAWGSMPAEQRKMDKLTSWLLVEKQQFKARVEDEESTSFTAFQMVKACRKRDRIGDGKVIQAVGIGDLKLRANDGHECLDTTLYNVLYVPNIKINHFLVLPQIKVTRYI
ncbi:hypothetical protein PR048_011987 [Dryococelus australis]|uniref:Retrovirus-related Pol polyprotein from transposon TNT 1-94-like beta-barrel domain-containing protein n=1 Tax=Dryococelus australis TaxID=614101 RepID=A0ABQ9HNG0_9NEOP|nr:hypothetical protein PR048_011987 [Dryococelus australis]